MSTFSGFIKPITDLANAHPGIAIAAGLASLATPYFLRDENREYFKSSLISTPIIGALALAGPGLVTSASRTTREGMQFARQMPFFFNRNASVKYADIKRFLDSGEIGPGIMGSALKGYVDDSAVEFFSQIDRGVPPIDLSMTKANELFNKLIGSEKNRELLTYAVEGAKLKSMSPTQLAGVSLPKDGKPFDFGVKLESELRETVEAFKGDPEFVKQLTRRLTWADKIKGNGGFISPTKAMQGETLYTKPFKEVEAQLASFRPKVASSLKSALDKGVIDSVTVLSEQVVGQQTGKLLGINVSKGKGPNLKTMMIPILDPETHTIRMGDGFQHVGVGRGFHTPHEVLDIDEYATKYLNLEDWSITERDIKRAGYWGGVDPLKEYKMAMDVEVQASVLSPLALRLRSDAVLPSSHPIYGGKYFNNPKESADLSLSAAERMNQLDNLRSLGYTRIGSEGGISKGLMEGGASELFTIGGLSSLAKSSPFYQSFSKGVQFGNIPDAWKPRVLSSAAAAYEVPSVRMTMAQISPMQKSLFGDLPSTVEGLAGYREKAVGYIMNDVNSSREFADAAYTKLSAELSKPGVLDSARRLGVLGEGNRILHEKFAGMSLQMKSTVEVDKLNPEFKAGYSFGPEETIGLSGLDPVSVNAPKTTVEEISSIGDKFRVKMVHDYPVETGIKIQDGVKGLAYVPPSFEFEHMRNILNMYGEVTGTETVIPDFVDAIASRHYTGDKMGEPFEVLLNQSEEVITRVQNSLTPMAEKLLKEGYNLEALTEINNYMFYLASEHIHYAPGIGLRGESSFVSGLNELERGSRIDRITQRTSSFFENISALAQKEAPGTGDSLFKSFRKSGNRNLLSYMEQNSMITNVAAWDSTRLNLPTSISATFDMFSEMYRGGNVEGIRDIYSRLNYLKGDPSGASKFIQHLMGMDFSKPIGTSIPIGKAAPGGTSLGNRESRINSIFDPTREDIQENFSLALDKSTMARIGNTEVEVSHVPILGKASHGGGANEYNGIEYASTEYEQSVAKLIEANKNGNPTNMSIALSNYFKESMQTVFGKEGFYRAKGVDPNAIAGFLQTRKADPFTMYISEDMVMRQKNKAIRESLLAGEDVTATVIRHPIQSAPYMKIKYDKGQFLGPNMVGMDERMRALFGADDDKDTFYLFMHGKETKAHEEAMRNIDRTHSKHITTQYDSLDTLEMLYGSKEDSRNIVNYEPKGLVDLIKEQLGVAGTAELRNKQLQKRMISATTGAYSNLETQLLTNLEMHPNLGGNQEARTMLGHLFWPIRQIPISAAKSQMQVGSEEPLALYNQLRSGLIAGNQEGANVFYGGMEKVVERFGKKSILNERTLPLYMQATGNTAEIGQEVNALSDILKSPKTREMLDDFVINRNPAADKAAKLITQQSENITSESLHMFREMEGAVPYLQGMAGEGKNSNVVSRTLGAINKGLAEAGRSAAKSFRPALPYLAAGLGIAALGGLLSTSLKSKTPTAGFNQASANNYRPEESTTVSDHIPGESMGGNMSSVNPPRRSLPAFSSTRTAMVAPMSQRTDLDVRMKASSMNDTAETQRLIRQVGGSRGITNVTTNYSGGWNTTASKLRKRQQIKEQLGDS